MSSDNGGIIGVVNDPTSTVASGVWQQEEQYEAKVNGTWPQRALFTTKSARFNQPSSDYLNRTPSSAGNQKTYTVSFWYKRTNFGAKDIIMSTTNGGSTFFNFGFIGSGTYADKFQVYHYDGTTDYGYHSSGLFRDISAWYHVVLAVDTTQGTESNRLKIYINGVQETLTATYGAFPQNLDTYFNNTNVHYIGYDHDSSGALLNGYLSEIINVDGQQLAPTSFGSTNSDGVWIPAIYTGTFGTNGFNLQFENASALGTDSSSNGNNFTVNNLTSIDQSTDYPEVNFATLNPLLGPRYSTQTFSNGNLTVAGGAGHEIHTSTIAVSKGKWYFEADLDAIGNYPIIGVIEASEVLTNNKDLNTYGYGYFFNGTISKLGSTVATYNSYTTNDVIGVALDVDNARVFFSKNGTWENSSDPANGTNPAITGLLTENLVFAVNNYGSTWSVNFGSPPYSISSGNTDGNGYGNFEYAVPSGYYSLNTKNLAEFG